VLNPVALPENPFVVVARERAPFDLDEEDPRVRFKDGWTQAQPGARLGISRYMRLTGVNGAR